MEKIIAVVSGKGGVGKTLMASNLGVHLAAQGKKTVIVDLNFQARGADLALGLESRVVYDIADVLSGVCRLRQATVKSKRHPGLFIMEPPLVKENVKVGPVEIKVLCEKLSDVFDWIILDMASGAAEPFEGIAALAKRVMVVSTQDPISVRTSEAVIRGLNNRQVWDRKLLLNQVKMNLTDKGYLMSVEDIVEILGIPLCGVLPYDDHIHVAFSNGNPIISKKDSPAGQHMEQIISRFMEP